MKELGAQISGIALDPPTDPSHYSSAQLDSDIQDIRIDLLDQKAIQQSIKDVQPDFLFHLAAQSLVR